MKNLINLKIPQKVTWLLGLSLSALVIVSCSQEDTIDLEENETLAGKNESFATPSDKKVYTIKNRSNGLTLDILGGSNSNGANLQVWGTDANTSSTNRQWEVLSVGSGYFRLKGVDSGKSIEISGGSNTTGANAQQWAYEGNSHQEWELLSTSSGYFRIKSRDSGKSLRVTGSNNGSNVHQAPWDGGQNQQWFFTEVGSNNSGDDDDDEDDEDDEDDDGGNGGSGDTPGAILDITNDDWKLNGFSDNPGSGADYHDDLMDEENANISTYSDNNYFYENNGWAYFKCYRGLGGSANSGNPRIELRELNGNGGNASWNGDNGSHIMSFTVRVDQLPVGYDDDDNEDRETGTLSFAQIHGPSGTNSNGVDVDDTIRVQFDGSAGQSSGSVRLKISGYITEEQGGGSESFEGYRLDTSYDMQLRFINDTVSLVVDGDTVFSRTMNTAGNGSYFKIGNYLQSVQGANFTRSYGLVGIKNLSISGH